MGPYEYIYICIYIKDEIHMERVTYIYREKEREGESDKEIEKTDSCCNIPHPYVPIPTPMKYGETNT